MKSMQCKLPSGVNFRAKIRDNSTIRTVREELSKQIKIPESYINLNISHRIRNLQNPTPIRSLGINPSDNIDVSFIPPRLSFQYGKTAPFSLPFQINSTIITAKKMLAPRFHVAPETIKLYLYNIELSEKQLLRDLRIPINRHIQIIIEKPKSKSALLFMMQHEAYRLEFPDETTVSQIKDELMRHADKATISIKLLYNGLYLDDNSVLKDLNINPKQCIIVESEMLEREDFILENNSFDDDENIDAMLDNSTHASRARTAIIKRRREMRQLSKQCNSNLASSQKVPIVQPDFSKTAPNTQRVRKSNSKNLSKTLSGSLKNSQEELEIEEEEGDETMTESQSLGKLTENQSAEKLTGNQSFDQPNYAGDFGKVGSGQNLSNLVESVQKLANNENDIIIEEEEIPDDDSSDQNSQDLTNMVGSLTKIAKSDSNNSAVVSRNLPATLEDSIPVEDQAGQPATLEDSIPVEDEAGQPATLEDSIPVEDEAGQPATLEDSIPVESSQSGSNLPNVLSKAASGLVQSGSEGKVEDLNEDEAGQPATLEDSVPVEDEAGQPATLEDSIPVEDEAGQPATLEDSVPVEDEAGQPATLEDSIPVESSQSGSNLPNVLSKAASGLVQSGSEGKVEDLNEDESGQPATLEDSVPVEDEAGQPATLEDSIPVEDEAGQPATLEDSIPVESSQSGSNLPNILSKAASGLVPSGSEGKVEDLNEDESGQPATLEDSVPVEDEAGQPATLEDSISVEDEAGQPATLEDSIPVESSQSGSNLPDILSNAANGLVPSGSEGKVEDFNDTKAGQDESEDQKVVDFNDAADDNGPTVTTRDISSNQSGEPATLEETAEDGQNLSNILSNAAQGLTNNLNDNDEPNQEEAEASNEPATLEDSIPVNDDEPNQEEAEASNEPATLEETAPSEGNGLSNLLSGVASGLTNSVDAETRDVDINNENENETESKTLELAEADEGADNEQTEKSGADLSQIVSGISQNLTEKSNDDTENEEAQQNDESNDQGGPDLSQIISGNASALTGDNNQDGDGDQPSAKGGLDLSGMVNSLL